jgi:hypothetical protein
MISQVTFRPFCGTPKFITVFTRAISCVPGSHFRCLSKVWLTCSSQGFEVVSGSSGYVSLRVSRRTSFRYCISPYSGFGTQFRTCHVRKLNLWHCRELGASQTFHHTPFLFVSVYTGNPSVGFWSSQPLATVRICQHKCAVVCLVVTVFTWARRWPWLEPGGPPS